MKEKKRKKSMLTFFGVFDAMALGTTGAFVADTVPEMDWSYGRSYWALAAFVCVIIGIFSLFAMFHVQAFYPTLDAHKENGKEVLDDTPKNRKFAKIMNTLKWVGVCAIMLGFIGWVLTQVVWGVN